jgi:hypothetical protein
MRGTESGSCRALFTTLCESMPVLTFSREFSMRVRVTERCAKRHRNDARAKSVVGRTGRDLGKVGIHQRKRPSVNEQKRMLFSPSGRRAIWSMNTVIQRYRRAPQLNRRNCSRDTFVHRAIRATRRLAAEASTFWDEGGTRV